MGLFGDRSVPSDHEVEQALSQAVADQARRLLAAIQDACRSIGETHLGRPVEEVTPLLRDAFAQRYVDPALADTFARFIAAGKQVAIRADINVK
ncbi:MAG TPA: hypothetical protein VK576_00145 [Thermoleophilia bacterium]|nr:hypothetical protein [Thermoleophilia bacterium]